jgi:hypothetical protein
MMFSEIIKLGTTKWPKLTVPPIGWLQTEGPLRYLPLPRECSLPTDLALRLLATTKKQY